MMDSTNLLAAQKVDRKINAVIGSAPSVAIYKYENGWVKSDHEGALLVCKRDGDPDCCVIILNQLRPQNFVQYLERGMSLQQKGEYLLFKTSLSLDVNAVWFYNVEDCGKICDILKRHFASQPTGPPWNPLASPSAANVLGGGNNMGNNAGMGKDILKMLSAAQKEAVQGRVQVQSGGRDLSGSAQVAAVIGGGGEGPGVHPVQLESLFNPSYGSERNGASGLATTPQKGAVGGNVSANDIGSGNGVGSGVNTTAMLQTGKGRGRVAEVPLALQRLLGTPGYGANDQQPVTASAFTNVGRQKAAATISPTVPSSVVADDLISSLRLDNITSGSTVTPSSGPSSMVPPIVPPFSSEDTALDWVTPADLGAGILDEHSPQSHYIQGTSVGPFSPSFVDQPKPRTPSTTPSLNVGQMSYTKEQFRQTYVYLLEHNDEFVDALYNSFIRAVQGRGGGGDAMKHSIRKN